MKKNTFLILILGLLLFQVVFLSDFKIFGIKPDLLLISVVLSALYLEFKSALLLSTLAGVLKDIFTVYPVGVNTLLFPLCCFFIVKLSKEISIDNGPVCFAAVCVISVMNALASRFVFIFLGNSAPVGLTLRIIILESLYSALVALIIFRLLQPVFISDY